MPLRLGSTSHSKLYVGATEVKSAFIGTTQVFDLVETPQIVITSTEATTVRGFEIVPCKTSGDFRLKGFDNPTIASEKTSGEQGGKLTFNHDPSTNIVTWHYTGNPRYLYDGQMDTEVFNVSVTDAQGAEATTQITVNVIGKDAPTSILIRCYRISGTAQTGSTIQLLDAENNILGTTTTTEAGEVISYSINHNGNWTFAQSDDLDVCQAARINVIKPGETEGTIIDLRPGTVPVDDLFGGTAQLILPVFVKGKWFYYLDLNGDGQGDTTVFQDNRSMNQLKPLFNQDIEGNVNPIGNQIDDTYRYAEINGVQLAIPTFGGLATTASGYPNPLAVRYPALGDALSTPYDDVLAIWDAFNRKSDNTANPNTYTNGFSARDNDWDGMPADWGYIPTDGWAVYWTATPSSSTGHARVILTLGNVHNNSDSFNGLVVVEVL